MNEIERYNAINLCKQEMKKQKQVRGAIKNEINILSNAPMKNRTNIQLYKRYYDEVNAKIKSYDLIIKELNNVSRLV